MRSYDANDEFCQGEALLLKARPWQLDALALNPSYNCWGPGEDYMGAKDDAGGWASAVESETWRDFSFRLDDLNVVANFYFQIERDQKACETCDSSGYNPATQEIYKGFYATEGYGPSWCGAITQDELDALVAEGRLKPGTSLADVNAINSRDTSRARRSELQRETGHYMHDAVNRFILIEARARRLGVWGKCSACEGQGKIYTSPEPDLQLVLWVLHPRKGASRGWTVKHIEQAELPAVRKFLAECARQNAERFAKVAAL